MPVLIGVFFGIPAGMLLKLSQGRTGILGILTAGITLTVLAGWFLNTRVLTGITLNYMLMGVAFSASFANMVREDKLGEINSAFSPILNVSLLAAVADLGTPLNFRLILGAGWYTFIYIAARAFGKYFGDDILPGTGVVHQNLKGIGVGAFQLLANHHQGHGAEQTSCINHD